MLHHKTQLECPECPDRILLLHQDLHKNPWGNVFAGAGLKWDYSPRPATKADLLKVRYIQEGPPVTGISTLAPASCVWPSLTLCQPHCPAAHSHAICVLTVNAMSGRRIFPGY